MTNTNMLIDIALPQRQKQPDAAGAFWLASQASRPTGNIGKHRSGNTCRKKTT